jgi:hypothetical protein
VICASLIQTQACRTAALLFPSQRQHPLPCNHLIHSDVTRKSQLPPKV